MCKGLEVVFSVNFIYISFFLFSYQLYITIYCLFYNRLTIPHTDKKIGFSNYLALLLKFSCQTVYFFTVCTIIWNNIYKL